MALDPFFFVPEGSAVTDQAKECGFHGLLLLFLLLLLSDDKPDERLFKYLVIAV